MGVMNLGLHGLLRRILSPFVAMRLTKEELCLSMAAIARLRLSQEDAVGLSLDAIAVRAQRVSHLCSPTELGMISDGATALFCTHDDLADALISVMYTAIVGKKDLSIRLSHVTAVLCYAASLKLYCSETISAIIKSAPSLLKKNDAGITIESFLKIAKRYLFLEEFCVLMSEMRKMATTDQLKVIDVHSHYDSSSDRGDLLPTDKEYSGNFEDDDDDNYGRKIRWSASHARRWMFLRARKNDEWAHEEILQAMELYAHFGIQDPVLQKMIDRAALPAILAAGTLCRDVFFKVVVAFPYLFPESSELLRKLCNESSAAADGNYTTMSKSGGADVSGFSLARAFKTTEAYERLLVGRRIPEDWMLEVVREQDGGAPVDVAAQAACIFAEKREIPEGIILQLSTQLNELSSRGVAAFVRAARRDTSGVLLLHRTAVLSHFAVKGVREATVETLLQVCAACAIPLPRGSDSVSNCDDEFGPKGCFAGSIITRVLSVMSGSTATIQLLCGLAKSAFALDTNNELVHFVCSTVCARKADMVIHDSLDLLDMLCSRRYVYEPLFDLIEPVLRQMVAFVMDKIENKVEVLFEEARQLATFAVLQADFDVPDFETSASLLMRSVEEHMDCMPIEVLPGAGLLLLRHMRCATVDKILDKISGKVCKLSDKALGELVKLISRPFESTNKKKIVTELVANVGNRVSLGCGNCSLSPDVVGLTVVVHCRFGETEDVVIQDSLVEYLLEWIGALCSQVYTELCSVIHLSKTGDLLANGLLDELPRRLNMLSTTEISSVIFGLGETTGIGQRLSHQLVAEKCSDYVIDHSHEFWSGKDISRMLYGFSRMLCTKRSLFNVFATRLALRPILIPMNQEAISLAVAAFGRAKYLDKRLLDKFSRRILEHLKDLNAADLLLVIRGFSRVMLLNDKLYNDLGNRAVEKSNEFPLEAQCAMLISFGSLGIEHERLATRMLDCIVEKLPEMENVKRAVDVIVSLWQMNHNVEDDKQVGKVADWIVERAGELDGDNIARLCFVLAETNWRHVPLLNAVAEQSVQLQIERNISAECCRTVLDTLGKFMFHHQGARERLSSLGKSVSKEKIQLSEEEEQQIQLLLRR